MNKILSVLLVLLCAAPFVTSAKTVVVDGRNVEIRKFIKATPTDGLNIRQQPSATSAKLVYRDEDADFGASPQDVAFWSKTALRRGELALKFFGPVEVLAESNGWYQIEVGDKKGWVSAKYCTEVIPEPITPGFVNENAAGMKWYEKDGQHRAVIMDYVGDAGSVKFYWCQLVDGLLVCLSTTGTDEDPIMLVEYDKPSDIVLRNIEYAPDSYEIACGTNLAINEWIPPVPDLNKISIDSDFFKKLQGLAVPLDQPRIFFKYGNTIF